MEPPVHQCVPEGRLHDHSYPYLSYFPEGGNWPLRPFAANGSMTNAACAPVHFHTDPGSQPGCSNAELFLGLLQHRRSFSGTEDGVQLRLRHRQHEQRAAHRCSTLLPRIPALASCGASSTAAILAHYSLQHCFPALPLRAA